MRIIFHVEIPEEDLKRDLRAATVGIGRRPVNIAFPWNLERVAEYIKNTDVDHEPFM